MAAPLPSLYFLMCADNVSKRARALRLIDRSIMPALVSACTRSILILLNKFINGGMRYRAAEAYIVRLIILCCVVRGSTLWFSLMRFEVGMHTVHIAMSFKYRFLWFLVSEAMLFFRFFWCYFHFSWSVDYKTRRFPNKFVVTLDAWAVPLFNTLVLISSRFSLTWGHHALVMGFQDACVCAMVITIMQRVVFSYFQYEEYKCCTYCINNGSFASIFYMATGFHRAHVQIRTVFLIYNLFRVSQGEFHKYRMLRFICGTWYWHFVDIVWIFLFITMYAPHTKFFA